MSQNNNMMNMFNKMTLSNSHHSAAPSSSKKKKSMKRKSIKKMKVNSVNNLASLFEHRFHPYGTASSKKRASTRKMKMNMNAMPSVHRMSTRSRKNAPLLSGLQNQKRSRAVKMAVNAANQAQEAAMIATHAAQAAASSDSSIHFGNNFHHALAEANAPIHFNDTFHHASHALFSQYPHDLARSRKVTRRHKKHGHRR